MPNVTPPRINLHDLLDHIVANTEEGPPLQPFITRVARVLEQCEPLDVVLKHLVKAFTGVAKGLDDAVRIVQDLLSGMMGKAPTNG